MVTQTISIERELYLKLNEIKMLHPDISFSGLVGLMVRRGFAYTALINKDKKV